MMALLAYTWQIPRTEMERAQVLEPESIARRHGQACHTLSPERKEQKLNMNAMQWLFLDLNAFPD
jgi:hypothetical protein